MTTAIEYSLFAGASYYDTRADLNRFPLPQDWGVYSRIPQDNSTGFEAVAFQSQCSNEIVISFAGTYPGNPDGALWPLIPVDIQADLALAAGILSDQLKQAADYYLQVKAANPDAVISFTGHSLGGGLASLMAVMFGESAYTFDQAPFLNSAITSTIIDPVTDSLVPRSVAIDLRAYLEGRASPDMLAPLDAFIAASDPFNSSPNPADILATRSGQVTNINTQGEFLSSWYLVPSSNRIGSQADIANIDNISGLDLHSQALLTAMLQSGDTPMSTASDHTLGQVTFKLTDLLKMIFDSNLFAYSTARSNTTNENFLERIARYGDGAQLIFHAT